MSPAAAARCRSVISDGPATSSHGPGGARKGPAPAAGRGPVAGASDSSARGRSAFAAVPSAAAVAAVAGRRGRAPAMSGRTALAGALLVTVPELPDLPPLPNFRCYRCCRRAPARGRHRPGNRAAGAAGRRARPPSQCVRSNSTFLPCFHAAITTVLRAAICLGSTLRPRGPGTPARGVRTILVMPPVACFSIPAPQRPATCTIFALTSIAASREFAPATPPSR